MDDEGIIDTYSRTQGLSPLDVLVAREKMQYLCDMYREVSKILSAKDLEALLMHIVDGRTYTEIGAYLRNEPITDENRSRIRMIGKRRIVKIKEALGYGVRYRRYIIWEQVLLDNPSMEEMRTPSFHIGWLCTRLQKINGGAYWGYNSHRKCKEYRDKPICLIPEYLEKSFGDKRTKCSICGIRCSQKLKFKEVLIE